MSCAYFFSFIIFFIFLILRKFIGFILQHYFITFYFVITNINLDRFLVDVML